MLDITEITLFYQIQDALTISGAYVIRICLVAGDGKISIVSFLHKFNKDTNNQRSLIKTTSCSRTRRLSLTKTFNLKEDDEKIEEK